MHKQQVLRKYKYNFKMKIPSVGNAPARTHDILAHFNFIHGPPSQLRVFLVRIKSIHNLLKVQNMTFWSES